MPEDDDTTRPNRKTRTPGPTREGDSLADVVELLLDKGVVINADIAVSVGETELLGIHIRAALASFETAAKYGLQFPDGTDAKRIEEASGRKPIEEGEEVDGDGAPISVRSPSRGGVSGRPRADEDEEDPDSAAEAVEEVAETVADETAGDGDESSDETDAAESETTENESAEGAPAENDADSEDESGDEAETESPEADDAD
ncbi:gas vesicle protein GvpJ [Halomarina salina]|uniref:Gas vesicle protein GvpJ n=1 Tax=Halomarina salina TaxID=1872699 RepID=A0ABD5RRF6_9EURY|nr:gas vesicle protein GvpJ [Halomarina salina]